MYSGDPVVKEAFTVAIAREQAWTSMSSTNCECSGNFFNIMVSSDPVVKESLIVGGA